MSTHPIVIVDVFAETRLAGNQLAVVLDAAGLSSKQMQAIALEMNFSETTFVLSQSPGRAAVRIFTPSSELPFAGHPTLGTGWVLSEGTGSIVLDLPAGEVPVAFDDGVGWMVPPEVSFGGVLPRAQVAELVGLQPEDFEDNLPVELAEVGPRFVLAPVKTLAALRGVRVDGEALQTLFGAGDGVGSVFLFTRESYSDDVDFAVRMFFESAGVREDPATGSANAAFAAYLRRHLGNVGSVRVDQGVEIGRPSRLYLEVGDVLRVGGKVHGVVRGEITV